VTSVVCIDDNRLLGDALGVRLAREPDFRWLGCLSRAELVERQLWRLAPDLLLLDLDVPGLDPFRLMEAAAERLPATRILIVTGLGGPADRDQALALGAWGFVSKGVSTPRLLEAMRRVMRGEVVLEDGLAGEDASPGPHGARAGSEDDPGEA